jgi:hypothetical protein
MIPDFPVLKEDLNRAITRFMRERFKVHQGPLSDVPQGQVFEGRRNVIVRQDGSEDEMKIREVSAETRIAFDEMRELHLPKLLESWMPRYRKWPPRKRGISTKRCPKVCKKSAIR